MTDKAPPRKQHRKQDADGAIIMGFDFGLRNIGVAVGQKITRTATPLCVIPARDGMPDWASMDEVVRAWQPALMVVGLPLNMDDTLSTMAVAAQKFSRRLQGRYTLSVELIDERLSSIAAAEHAPPPRQGKKSARIDDIAAGLILETWLKGND